MQIGKIEQLTTNNSFIDVPDSLRNQDNLVAELRKRNKELEYQLDLISLFVPAGLPSLLRTQAS